METPARLAIKEAQTAFEGLAEELGLESEEDVAGQKIMGILIDTNNTKGDSEVDILYTFFYTLKISYIGSI